jgi:hypothetical protein
MWARIRDIPGSADEAVTGLHTARDRRLAHLAALDDDALPRPLMRARPA